MCVCVCAHVRVCVHVCVHVCVVGREGAYLNVASQDFKLAFITIDLPYSFLVCECLEKSVISF